MTAESYGARLKRERRRWGVRATTLARLAGVHRNTICRWEGGDGVPDILQAERIREALREARQQWEAKLAAGGQPGRFVPEDGAR